MYPRPLIPWELVTVDCGIHRERLGHHCSMPIFLLQWVRQSFIHTQSFIPTQNNKQNYTSVYFNLYVLGQQTVRQNILQCIFDQQLSIFISAWLFKIMFLQEELQRDFTRSLTMQAVIFHFHIMSVTWRANFLYSLLAFEVKEQRQMTVRSFLQISTV